MGRRVWHEDFENVGGHGGDDALSIAAESRGPRAYRNGKEMVPDSDISNKQWRRPLSEQGSDGEFRGLKSLAGPRGFYVVDLGNGDWAFERKRQRFFTGNFTEACVWLRTQPVLPSRN